MRAERDDVVVDIADLFGGAAGEWAPLRAALAALQSTVFEPPAALLPAVFARLDAVSRLRWVGPRNQRWVAYAAAAGAVVLASRSRRRLVG